MKFLKSIVIGHLTALALQACAEQGADPAKVQADVAIARAQGEEKIARAQETLDRAKIIMNTAPLNPDSGGKTTGMPPTSVDAPGTTTITFDPASRLADAQFDLDKAKAEQSYDIALARCEDRVGDANKACRDSAKSAYSGALDLAKSKMQTPHHRKDDF